MGSPKEDGKGQGALDGARPDEAREADMVLMSKKNRHSESGVFGCVQSSKVVRWPKCLSKIKKYPHSCNFMLIPTHYFVFSVDPKTKVKIFEMLFSDRQPVR